MKIVVNRCYGGFWLSDEAAAWMQKRNPQIKLECCNDEDTPSDCWYCEDRGDPLLVECIETLGKDASGYCARLQVAVIPDEATDWEIDNNDGYEKIVYVLGGKIHRAMTEEEEKEMQEYLARAGEVST